jgi:hypothetical protein
MNTNQVTCGAEDLGVRCYRNEGHPGEHRGYLAGPHQVVFWTEPEAQNICDWHPAGEETWQGSCGVRAFDQLVKTEQVVFCMLCGKRVRLVTPQANQSVHSTQRDRRNA